MKSYEITYMHLNMQKSEHSTCNLGYHGPQTTAVRLQKQQLSNIPLGSEVWNDCSEQSRQVTDSTSRECSWRLFQTDVLQSQRSGINPTAEGLARLVYVVRNTKEVEKVLIKFSKEDERRDEHVCNAVHLSRALTSVLFTTGRCVFLQVYTYVFLKFWFLKCGPWLTLNQDFKEFCLLIT